VTILCFPALILVLVLPVWAHRAYVWNRAVCRKNGLPWRLEDQDIHGSKLWKAGDVEVWL
jgi:hypothetical protein